MLKVKTLARSLVILGMAACFVACGGKPAPAPGAAPATEAEATALVVKFKEIADAAQKDKYKQADVGQLSKITASLAQMGPGGIDKLLDLLAQADTHPRTKMLITMSVKDHIAKENLARLLELTDPSYEVNTRVNAAHLVGSYNEPLLLPRSMELLKDPEPRVRLATFQVQLLRGAPEALALVDEYWNAPDTPEADKGQIVNGIPEAEAAKHMPIYMSAAGNTLFDTVVRERAITMLGRHGDATALPVLDTIVANAGDDPGLQGQAKLAADALRSRLGQPAEASPTPAPAAGPGAAPAV